MSNTLTEDEMDRRHASRTEYVIRSGSGCRHPADALVFLGPQGTNVYYQCQQCDSVIISALGEA